MDFSKFKTFSLIMNIWKYMMLFMGYRKQKKNNCEKIRGKGILKK